MLTEFDNTQRYNQQKFLSQLSRFRQSRFSVISKIITIKIDDPILGEIQLVEYLDGSVSNLKKFIGIIMSELIGWTESTVNNNILQEIKTFDDKFDLIIDAVRSKFQIFRTNNDPDTLCNAIIDLFAEVSELEEINGDLTLLNLQYEMRRLTTDLFNEMVFEASKPIIIRKAAKKKIRSINFINKQIIEKLCLINKRILTGGIVSTNELPDIEFDLDAHKAKLMEFRNTYLLILQKYLGELSDTQIRRLINGLINEENQDLDTLPLVIEDRHYDIEMEQFNVRDEKFFGNSHFRPLPSNEVQTLPANENALTRQSYYVSKLRSYKDCHGYAATVKFARWLESILKPALRSGDFIGFVLRNQ